MHIQLRLRGHSRPPKGRNPRVQGYNPNLDPERRERLNWKTSARRRLPYLLLVPVFTLIFGISVAPSIYSIYLSLTKYNIFLNRHPVWDGLNQFSFLIYHDPFFSQTVLVTLEWVAIVIGFNYSFGLGVAKLLNQPGLKGKTFYRVGFMASFAAPITGIWPIWDRILSPSNGLLNYYLEQIGLESYKHPITWLNSYPLVTIALIGLWSGFAFGAIVLLAQLQSIPKEEYESAKLDAAGRWGRFRYIEWPHLMPLNVILWMLGIISALNTFNIIYVLTGGGPGFASTTIYLYAFRTLTTGDYAYTAAISVMLFLVEMVVAAFYIRYVWLRKT
jgi:multiple sugar transport system permease protein